MKGPVSFALKNLTKVGYDLVRYGLIIFFVGPAFAFESYSLASGFLGRCDVLVEAVAYYGCVGGI